MPRLLILSSRGLAVWSGSKRRAFMPWDASPRLRKASQEAREDIELFDGGNGLRWPSVDEDLSVAGILRDFAVSA
jgi:hypothetical protein